MTRRGHSSCVMPNDVRFRSSRHVGRNRRGWTLSVGQNKGDIKVDAILCDLAVLNDHLLLLDPRALYIRQFLGGPGDTLLYSVLEALVRAGDDLGDSRNGHDRLLVCVNSATSVKRLARETAITIAFKKAVFVHGFRSTQCNGTHADLLAWWN